LADAKQLRFTSCKKFHGLHWPVSGPSWLSVSLFVRKVVTFIYFSLNRRMRWTDNQGVYFKKGLAVSEADRMQRYHFIFQIDTSGGPSGVL
jgi:hypothetical protein